LGQQHIKDKELEIINMFFLTPKEWCGLVRRSISGPRSAPLTLEERREKNISASQAKAAQ